MITRLLLALLGAPVIQETPQDPGWTIRETTNATTGAKATAASIRSADGTARLIVRCDTAVRPIVSVQFIPTPRLPAGPSNSVQVTFDESRADTGSWEFPGAGAYVGYPVIVWSLVTSIAESRTIRVTTWDAAGTSIEGVFAGPGSDMLFRQVYTACGFPYETPPVGLTQE